MVDELGFHQATSVAELLADRGCQVEIVTNGMVVGQDLGITLDLETWNVRAHAKGIRQATDLVPHGLGRSRRTSGGRRCTCSTTRPARTGTGSCDWVVCSLHQQPDDELWHELAGAAVPGPPRRRLPGSPPGPRRGHRRPPGGGGPVSRTAGGASPDRSWRVVVARDGRLPAGADEAVAEAGGRVLVVGSGAEDGGVHAGPGGAGQAWWADTGTGAAARLARRLAPVLEPRPAGAPAGVAGRPGPGAAAGRAPLDRPLLAGRAIAGRAGRRPGASADLLPGRRPGRGARRRGRRRPSPP